MKEWKRILNSVAAVPFSVSSWAGILKENMRDTLTKVCPEPRFPTLCGPATRTPVQNPTLHQQNMSAFWEFSADA